jgi:hypothetical protein
MVAWQRDPERVEAISTIMQWWGARRFGNGDGHVNCRWGASGGNSGESRMELGAALVSLPLAAEDKLMGKKR